MPWREGIQKVKHGGDEIASGPIQFGDHEPGLYLDAEELEKMHLLIEMTICSVRELDKSKVAESFIVKPLREFVDQIECRDEVAGAISCGEKRER